MVVAEKFNVLGYVINIGYMNDEYQTRAERRYSVRIFDITVYVEIRVINQLLNF